MKPSETQILNYLEEVQNFITKITNQELDHDEIIKERERLLQLKKSIM